MSNRESFQTGVKLRNVTNSAAIYMVQFHGIRLLEFAVKTGLEARDT